MSAFDSIKLLRLKKYLPCTLSRSRLVPNSPPLFAIVFWGETNRSSLSQMFFKISVLKNFANFIGKHQYWSIFLTKLLAWRPATLLKKETPTQVFSCEICKIFIIYFIYSLFIVTNKTTVYNKNSHVYIHANWRQLPNVEKMKTVN